MLSIIVLIWCCHKRIPKVGYWRNKNLYLNDSGGWQIKVVGPLFDDSCCIIPWQKSSW